MLKQFFRTLRKTAKKIAPIAAPIAGFYFGAPIGAGIGALLGQYGGKEGALKAAMLGGIGGLAGNYATTGKLLGTKGVAGSGVSTKDAIMNLIAGQPTGAGQTIGEKSVRFGGGISDYLSMAKLPIIGGAVTALLNQDDDDGVEKRPDIEIGSVPPFDVTPTDIIYPDPVDPVNVYGFASGGIVGLKKGGTVDDFGGIEAFNRKNGEIAGPGTMTSDDIPAMLSDGEFVTKAVSVLGAGVKYGGAKTVEEARDKGAEFFYKQQKELEPFGRKVT